MTTAEIQEELELSLSIAKGSFFKRPEFGHRFKELRNAAASEGTRRKAREFALEALQWMVDLKHLKTLSAAAEYDDDNRLLVSVEATAFTGAAVSFSRFVEVADVA
jgi:phage gp46-like protein